MKHLMEAKWLPGQPTEPGLYWWALLFKGASELRFCRVWACEMDITGIRKGELVTGSYLKIAGMHRRWAGPLLEPSMPPPDIERGRDHEQGAD